MAPIAGKPVGRILISNDDGIDAIGISLLRDIAARLSDDIWVIAPTNNRSGASRSITLRSDVVIDHRIGCIGHTRIVVEAHRRNIRLVHRLVILGLQQIGRAHV